MIDRMAIAKRYFSCFPGISRTEMAKLMGVQIPTVTQWENKWGVPWSKLKYLSDSQAVSWDWLIAGREPKVSIKQAVAPRTTSPRFSRPKINKRFLSLFSAMNQTEVANLFGISSAAVSDWHQNKSQVPWEKLDYAAETCRVRWDWLLDGLEPIYWEGKSDQRT